MGLQVLQAAGIPIAGGHSIDNPEPLYGLVAIGLVHPARIKRNNLAQAGDVLILAKGIGVGVMSAALKKGELREKAYQQMIDVTTQLNTPGIALSALPGVHAMTDVTGFGLLGHLHEMCRGSKLQADIRYAACFNLGQQLCHSVDKRLASDKPDGRIGQRLRKQMLPAAETDF